MISAKRVDKIFMDSLFRKEEVIDGKPIVEPLKVEGIVNNFGFHPDRVKSHEEEIIQILKELPDEFRKDKGGGWTFLNACNTKDGEQWGEHRNMEQLFCMGIAIGKVNYTLPREMWGALPGGMPYLVIDI